MAFRTGRCTNDLFCSFASGQQDLQVPAEGNFVCPQCGKALSDPPANAGRGGMRLAVVTGGSLAAAGAMLFLAGMFLGGRGISPPVGTTELAATTTTRPTVPPPPAPVHADNAARKAIVDSDASPPPAPVPAPVPAPAAHAVTAEAAPPQAGAATAAQAAAQRPAPIAAAPTPVLPPPIQLAMVEQPRTVPPAPVAVPRPSVAPKPVGPAQTRDSEAQASQDKRAQALAEQARKAKALSEQARKDKALAEAKRKQQDALDAEREAAEARAAQEEAAKERAAQDEAARQRAAQEAAAKPPVAVAMAQPPAPKPAAAPTGPSRGFSTSPVAGGAPPYPTELENDGRSGSVTVACRILEDGHPSGCRVVSARGGEPFKAAVLGWLNSGRVRYAPILHGGKPVAETHQWNVQFQPE